MERHYYQRMDWAMPCSNKPMHGEICPGGGGNLGRGGGKSIRSAVARQLGARVLFSTGWQHLFFANFSNGHHWKGKRCHSFSERQSIIHVLTFSAMATPPSTGGTEQCHVKYSLANTHAHSLSLAFSRFLSALSFSVSLSDSLTLSPPSLFSSSPSLCLTLSLSLSLTLYLTV